MIMHELQDGWLDSGVDSGMETAATTTSPATASSIIEAERFAADEGIVRFWKGLK
jgi:hypothetical protein